MYGRILIVDGRATGRITLKVRLAAACYDPVTARTGAEAMASLARSGPMPVLIGGPPGDMDQATLCAQIVAAWPGAPVMMVVPPDSRVAALRAGAAALFDPQIDEINLLARMRGLMRDNAGGGTVAIPATGLAEAQAPFDPRPETARSVLLIAGDAGAAMSWRHALSGRLSAQLRIADAERALTEAAIGVVPDLYVMACDIAQPGDGLRLLSELRSRRPSRDAAFAVVLAPERMDMMPVALDLGAGDVLSADFAALGEAEEAALRLDLLIRRKQIADSNRNAAEQERALARLDPLTGLPNRRFALPGLTEICTHALATGRPCAVVAIDIDRFKAVNDRYGHATGDAVLAAAARRMQEAMPTSGFIARMGGEEFLAVLPEADDRHAAEIAEGLRAAVSSAPICAPSLPDHGGAGLRITISAGVASLGRVMQGSAADHAAALLEQADAALLCAKRAGRDRLMVSRADAAA